MATAEDILKKIQDEDIQLVDLKFIDLPGIWQHLTLHVSQIDASSFTDGVAFDGSSIRAGRPLTNPT
jgi:glutamine synthetase